jgi:Domain of unknown function (DUF4440)
MSNDEDDLRQLNIEIGCAETDGNVKRLAEILAPELAFSRADGKTIDDAGRFLQKVQPGSPRVTTFDAELASIEVLGNRAIVKCLVTMESPDGERKYHNLRLFVRIDRKWRLLAWANEPS